MTREALYAWKKTTVKGIKPRTGLQTLLRDCGVSGDESCRAVSVRVPLYGTISVMHTGSKNAHWFKG